MAPRTPFRRRPRLESLEERIVLSLAAGSPTYGLTPPVNTVSLSLGNAVRPGQVSSTTATIVPMNITPGKASTEFGVFVQPYGNSGVVPKIVGVRENGRVLPFQAARMYSPAQAGQHTDMTVGFFEAKKAGTVQILVKAQALSAGQYTVETTLVGDVNGDGTVNLADQQAFAQSYAESYGQTGYQASADSNQNGIVNLYDALAVERNMPIYAPRRKNLVAVNLSPQTAIYHAGSQNSGGVTAQKNITISGYVQPGSIVLADNKDGTYKFNSQAIGTTSQGFFNIAAVASGNTAGLVTYNFKVLDPYGQQIIRSFPVLWTAYARPNSPYNYEPAGAHRYGTGKFGTPGVPINAP